MFLDFVINVGENLINGAVGITQWAISPVATIGDLTITPIYVFSFTFLVAYLIIAIVRWII